MRMRNAARLSTTFTMRRHFKGGVYTVEPLSSAATFRGRRHFEEIRYTSIYRAEICAILLHLRCSFQRYHVSPKSASKKSMCNMYSVT